MNFFQRLTKILSQQGNLSALIILNVALFLMVNLAKHLAHINVIPYLELQIGGMEFIFRPWTLFTYMFVHANIFELVFNLLLLYFTGQLYFHIFGEKRLIYTYVMSGICGAALLLILGILIPGSFFNTTLLGASSAVLGVVMVMAVYSPDFKVSLFGAFTMSYKYFALLIFIVSTLLDFSFNSGGKISHVGGVLFGLTYGYYLKKGTDLFNFAFLTRKRNKLKVVSYNRMSDDEYNEHRVSEEQEMNGLLDKISRSGYDSLTKKEKETLFRLSQKK